MNDVITELSRSLRLANNEVENTNFGRVQQHLLIADKCIAALTQHHQDIMSEVAGNVRLLLSKHYKTEDFDSEGFLNDLRTFETQTIIKSK